MTTTIDHLDDARHHAGAMDDPAASDPEVPERSPGRRRFSAKYKMKILTEYDALEDKTARVPSSDGKGSTRRTSPPGATSVTMGVIRRWPDRQAVRRVTPVTGRSPG